VGAEVLEEEAGFVFRDLFHPDINTALHGVTTQNEV
jgi:hypothetical protein